MEDNKIVTLDFLKNSFWNKCKLSLSQYSCTVSGNLILIQYNNPGDNCTIYGTFTCCGSNGEIVDINATFSLRENGLDIAGALALSGDGLEVEYINYTYNTIVIKFSRLVSRISCYVYTSLSNINLVSNVGTIASNSIVDGYVVSNDEYEIGDATPNGVVTGKVSTIGNTIVNNYEGSIPEVRTVLELDAYEDGERRTVVYDPFTADGDANNGYRHTIPEIYQAHYSSEAEHAVEAESAQTADSADKLSYTLTIILEGDITGQGSFLPGQTSVTINTLTSNTITPELFVQDASGDTINLDTAVPLTGPVVGSINNDGIDVTIILNRGSNIAHPYPVNIAKKLQNDPSIIFTGDVLSNIINIATGIDAPTTINTTIPALAELSDMIGNITGECSCTKLSIVSKVLTNTEVTENEPSNGILIVDKVKDINFGTDVVSIGYMESNCDTKPCIIDRASVADSIRDGSIILSGAVTSNASQLKGNVLIDTTLNTPKFISDVSTYLHMNCDPEIEELKGVVVCGHSLDEITSLGVLGNAGAVYLEMHLRYPTKYITDVLDMHSLYTVEEIEENKNKVNIFLDFDLDEYYLIDLTNIEVSEINIYFNGIATSNKLSRLLIDTDNKIYTSSDIDIILHDTYLIQPVLDNNTTQPTVHFNDTYNLSTKAVGSKIFRFDRMVNVNKNKIYYIVD